MNPLTLELLVAERLRQNAKWGEQNHPDGTGSPYSTIDANYYRMRCDTAFAEGRGTWAHILQEEVAEAIAETAPDKLTAELIQVAAVVLAWVEAVQRKAGTP